MTKKPKRPAPRKSRNSSPKKAPRPLSKAAKLKASQEEAAKRTLEHIRRRDYFVEHILYPRYVRMKRLWDIEESVKAKASIRPDLDQD